MLLTQPMDRRQLLALLSVSWAGAGAWLPAQETNPAALRIELERVYEQWLTAMRQLDVAGFATYTSRYRQLSLRNEVISLKQPWPMAVFRNVIHAPALSGLKYLSVHATGDMARLVYYGRVDLELGSAAPENALILHFLKDYGQWRFDRLQYANCGDDQDTRAKIANGDQKWLDEPEFYLSGKAPALPKACREPYLIAGLSIIAYHCEVTVEVNGAHRVTVSQNADARIITGGLQKGPNPITITAKKAPVAGGTPELSLAIFVKTTPTAKPTRYWEWKPPAPAWEPSYGHSLFVKSTALR